MEHKTISPLIRYLFNPLSYIVSIKMYLLLIGSGHEHYLYNACSLALVRRNTGSMPKILTYMEWYENAELCISSP